MPMNDTSPEIEKMLRDRYMALTAVERLQMGVRSFVAARAMVLASFPQDLSPNEVRRRLFERLYGPVENFPGIKFSDDPL